MAIKITTKSSEIPVVINDLEFTVIATDENLKRIRQSAIDVHDKLQGVTDNDLDVIRDAILSVFDVVLGDGAGKKIYDKVRSTMICVNILNQLKEGLEKEFKERGLSLSEQDKAGQYLQAKQRRNKYKK